MTVYQKTIGRFELTMSAQLTVTDPSPMWTTINTDREDCRLFGLDEDDLEDLHYLIGRAIQAQQAKRKDRRYGTR